LIVDYRFDPLFPIAQGTLPWRPILGLKWAKSADSPSFVALAILMAYRNFDFKIHLPRCGYVAIRRVNFWCDAVGLTPELQRGKGLHPIDF